MLFIVIFVKTGKIDMGNHRDRLATNEQNSSKGGRIARAGFGAIGLLCVSLGFIGLFVPGLPTTIFCILALWCFKRSNAKLENWLLNHKWLGPTLRDWEENHWISLRAKKFAIASITIFSIFGCLMIRKPDPVIAWTIRGAILAFAAFGVWYVASRRTKPLLTVAKAQDSLAA